MSSSYPPTAFRGVPTMPNNRQIYPKGLLHFALGVAALALLVSGLWHILSGADTYDRLPGFGFFFPASMTCLILRHHLDWLEKPIVSAVFGAVMTGAALDLAFWQAVYAWFCAAAISLLILALLLYWARRTEPNHDQQRQAPEGAGGVRNLAWIIGAAILLIPKSLIDTIRRAPNTD